MFGFLLGCMVMVIVISDSLKSLRNRKGEGRGSRRKKDSQAEAEAEYRQEGREKVTKVRVTRKREKHFTKVTFQILRFHLLKSLH